MAVGVLLLALHPHHVIVIVAMLLRRFLSPWICRYWMEWLDQRQQQQQQQQRHSSRSSTNTSTLSSSSPRFRQWIVQSLVEGGPLGRGCRKLVNGVLGLIVLGLAGHFVVSKRRVGEQEEPQWPLATNNKFATILWSHIHLGDLGGSSNHDDDHDSTNMRPAVPLWQIVLGLCLLSGAVNVVLWLWSKYCIPTTPQTSSTTGTPRGNKTTTTTIRAAVHHHHKGVDELVQSTVGRSLSLSEHFGLGLWALINAVCEELESRGLNRVEFTALAHFCEEDDDDDRSIFWATTTTPSSSSATAALSFQPLLLRLAAKIGLQNHNPITASSNFWQATVFGLSHYYGIPSGWTGVALTFVYGWILGLLATVLGSSSRSSSSSTPGSSSPCALWAPIATHALADYFIFAYIARQQQQQGQQQQGQQQQGQQQLGQQQLGQQQLGQQQQGQQQRNHG